MEPAPLPRSGQGLDPRLLRDTRLPLAESTEIADFERFRPEANGRSSFGPRLAAGQAEASDSAIFVDLP